jgi:hypothetical protein
VPRKKTLSAEEIQQKWRVEELGHPWPLPEGYRYDPVTDRVLEEGRSVGRAAGGRSPTVMSTRREDKHSPTPRQDLSKKLDDLFARHGVEPAEELIMMAMERGEDGQHRLSDEQRIRVWSELLGYRMPKLRSMEVRGEVDHSLTVIVRKFGEDVIIERDASKSLGAPIDVEIKKIGEGE